MGKKCFYGWFICAGCTLLLFITMGMVSNGFSLFLPYLIDENHFSHAQGSFLVTLRCLVSFGAMVVIGVYYKKLGLRRGCFLAALSVAGAFFLYSLSHSYLSFCLGAALSGVGYGLGSMVPVSILIHNWFVERRALALGICGCGSALGSTILPPITQGLIGRFSVSGAFGAEALFVCGGAAVILLVLRDRPQQMGLCPYGEPEQSTGEPLWESVPQEDRPLSPAAWGMLAFVALSMGALANPGLLHLPVLYTTEGLDSHQVALLISLLGVTLILGKLLFGAVTDRIGGFASSLLFSFLLLGAHILCSLAFLDSLPLDMAAMVLLGFGYPISTLGFAVWANDMVSPNRFSQMVQRLQVIYAGGALVFASLPGILCDRLGSYVPTYLLFSAMLAVIPLLLLLTYRRQRAALGSPGDTR